MAYSPHESAAHRGSRLAEPGAARSEPAAAPGKRTLTMELPEPDHAAPPRAGAAMPAEVQARMEHAFHADFSAVRIHEGPEASRLGALAYTRGTDIHFAPGRYAPNSQSGQELLGHELAHVVQQSRGRAGGGAQAKGLPINADPALEREADEQGARAARGEPVSPGESRGTARTPIAAASAPAIQRFRDPQTDAEVNPDLIADHATAVRYAKLVQTKQPQLGIAEFRRLMLRLKVLEQQRLGGAVVEGMALANSQDGPSYHHNVDPATLAELVDTGQRPDLGYADPAYFERLSKFTWRVRANVSAAAALRAFLQPDQVTVAECQTALQAAQYHAVLRAVGAARFDAKLGSADVLVPDADRLQLQMDYQDGNPLAKFIADMRVDLDPQEKGELRRNGEDGHLISEPDHRPASLGGWYYMKNHAFYSERHRGGLWGGENVIYVGRDELGAQVFSGFGLANRTEQEMAEALATECNRPPSDERTEALVHERKFGLALPRLGDLRSIADMPMTDAMTKVVDHEWTKAGRIGPASPNARLARDRLKGLMKNMALPPPVTAADILHTVDTDHLEGMGDQPQNERLAARHIEVAWTDGVENDVPHKVLTIKKTTDNQVRLPRTELLKLYCSQFSLEYLSKDMNEAFAHMNQGALLNVTLTKGGTVFRFPAPEVYVRRHTTPAGFQTLGGRTLSIEKIKNEFGLVHLFDG